MGTNLNDDRGIEALLFDFGGTLAFVDFDLLAREFSRPGLKLTAAALEEAEYAGRRALDELLMSGRGWRLDQAYRVLFDAWMKAAGLEDRELDECAARFREIHREANMWRVLHSGVFELLERLRTAGFKLGVVSNAEGQIEADMRALKLAPYFDTIIDSHVVAVAKPDPRIFHIALERLGVAPHRALFAGDIYSIDMIGAQAAGVRGKLIDRMGRYDWVGHTRIRGIDELHSLA